MAADGQRPIRAAQPGVLLIPVVFLSLLSHPEASLLNVSFAMLLSPPFSPSLFSLPIYFSPVLLIFFFFFACLAVSTTPFLFLSLSLSVALFLFEEADQGLGWAGQRGHGEPKVDEHSCCMEKWELFARPLRAALCHTAPRRATLFMVIVVATFVMRPGLCLKLKACRH